MRIRSVKRLCKRTQCGATMIEVLIAILLFSIGTLSVGLMLSYAVQLPKLAAYRATATHLAAGHIERMRANPKGNHTSDLNYDGNFSHLALADCTYPNCNTESLSAMDKASTQKKAREQLPAGGLQVSCDDTPCTSGNLWLVWQEPSTLAALKGQYSDDCPPQVIDRFTKPSPRCHYVRFRL